MSVRKISKAVKLATLLSAGKIALAAQTTYAEDVLGAEGKAGDQPTKPPVTLNQMASPLHVIAPAFNDENIEEGFFAEEIDTLETAGIIYAKDAKDARLDFIVSNLPGDKPVDVYLVYSTGLAPFAEGDEFPGLKPRDHMMDGDGTMPPSDGDGTMPPPDGDGTMPPSDGDGTMPPPDGDGTMPPPNGDGTMPPPDGDVAPQPRAEKKSQRFPNVRPIDAPQPKLDAPEPPPVESGKICIDMNHLNIIAGVSVQPPVQFIGDQTPLGRTLRNPNSVTVSVQLSDLKGVLDQSDEIFFQAVVFPAGTETPDFTQGRASECDRYIISHEGAMLSDGSTDTGSKEEALEDDNTTDTGDNGSTSETDSAK